MKSNQLILVVLFGLAACNPGSAVERYQIPLGHAPGRWSEAASVTIVEYSDYQCPFCSRVEETLKRIEKAYDGKGVRLVWKDNPLPMHPDATLAAVAARAAGEQGRFWAMHDLLLQNQNRLARADLEAYAAQLGLDLVKFRAALESDHLQREVQGDLAEAQNFGVRGTPSFFVNGRPLRGAQPFEQFKTVIDEELRRAELLIARGLQPAAVYAEITRDGLVKAAPMPNRQAAVPGRSIAARSAQPRPDLEVTYRAEVGRSPVRGIPGAKVTIVVWSDFECPFCARLASTLAQVMDIYGSDVRVVWKNLPLGFHEHAVAAAQAALAAGEQGKFWEMHDLLFKNQRQLTREDVDGYARALGLDMTRFRTALDTPRLKRDIDEDVALGNRLGVRGTPTLFINGRLLVGAQPLDAIKVRIDEELKRADALIAKGTSPGQLYDRLMLEAKTEVAVKEGTGPQGCGLKPGCAGGEDCDCAHAAQR